MWINCTSKPASYRPFSCSPMQLWHCKLKKPKVPVLFCFFNVVLDLGHKIQISCLTNTVLHWSSGLGPETAWLWASAQREKPTLCLAPWPLSAVSTCHHILHQVAHTLVATSEIMSVRWGIFLHPQALLLPEDPSQQQPGRLAESSCPGGKVLCSAAGENAMRDARLNYW